MKYFALFLGAIALVIAVLFSVSWLTAAEIKVGESAPDFSLAGSDGKTHKLADYRGKQAVVLAWFPKAFSPGCTNECKAFAEKGDKLRQFDVAYFTVSVDDADQNKKFAESLKADYPILSDPKGEAARRYGVTDAVKKWASRWTFIIGKDGKILYIDRNVDPANHVDDLVKKLDELNVAKK